MEPQRASPAPRYGRRRTISRGPGLPGGVRSVSSRRRIPVAALRRERDQRSFHAGLPGTVRSNRLSPSGRCRRVLACDNHEAHGLPVSGVRRLKGDAPASPSASAIRTRPIGGWYLTGFFRTDSESIDPGNVMPSAAIIKRAYRREGIRALTRELRPLQRNRSS